MPSKGDLRVRALSHLLQSLNVGLEEGATTRFATPTARPSSYRTFAKSRPAKD